MSAKYSEIFKLKEMLEKDNIPFVFTDLKSVIPEYPMEHYQIECPVSGKGRVISVIQGYGTYGEDDDLLEIMGLLTPKEQTHDSVAGHLTADDVLSRIKKAVMERGAIMADERLTRRLTDGRADCAFCDGNFDEEGNCKNDCSLRVAQLDKLAAYEDKAEQGLLVELPCKVGDTVYVIYDGEITKRQVIYFMLGGSGYTAACYTQKPTDKYKEKQYDASFDMFGKTVFLTPEEAEKALKEHEGK